MKRLCLALLALAMLLVVAQDASAFGFGLRRTNVTIVNNAPPVVVQQPGFALVQAQSAGCGSLAVGYGGFVRGSVGHIGHVGHVGGFAPRVAVRAPGFRLVVR